MKRMFYAAHTPSFLSLFLLLSLSLTRSPVLPFSFSSSLHLIFRPVSVFVPCAAAVSLVGQNTYRTYRLLRAAFPVILSGHRRPGRELLLTCMHVVPPPLLFTPCHPLVGPVNVFIRYNETSRDAQRDTCEFSQFVGRIIVFKK